MTPPYHQYSHIPLPLITSTASWFLLAEHLLRFRDIAFAGAMMNFIVAPITLYLQSL
ncbi:hypothetical protein PG989_000488 [Apiospora arundinis]